MCKLYQIKLSKNRTEQEEGTIWEVILSPELFSSSKFVDQSAKKYKSILKEHS